MSITEVTSPVPKTPLQEFWHYFSQNRGAVIGLAFIAVVFFYERVCRGNFPV